MIRRSIHFSRELWDSIRRAAANESADRGRTVSMSEWIREAVREKLADTDAE